MSKFRRTFLVLVLPLVGMGAFTAHVMAPYPRHFYVMCHREGGNRAWCEDAGPYEDTRRQEIRARGRSWFDFSVADRFDDFITNMIEVEGDFLYDVVVLKADRRPGLAGSQVDVQVGYGPPYAATPEGDGILNCNGVAFFPREDVYQSPCRRTEPFWTGGVEFRPSNADRHMLDQVRRSARLLTEHRRIGYLLHLASMYSLYVGLFLALSAGVWLVQRAVRYMLHPAGQPDQSAP